MRACAATGGVIGICGVGMFLGANDASVETFVRHLEYAVELVGPKHVGIGTDYVFDLSDLEAELARNPGLFPRKTISDPEDFLPPERLRDVAETLLRNGHTTETVIDVLGGNFLRIAEQVWR